eukprot:6766973-Prymnesium_polylepis.1
MLAFLPRYFVGTWNFDDDEPFDSMIERSFGIECAKRSSGSSASAMRTSASRASRKQCRPSACGSAALSSKRRAARWKFPSIRARRTWRARVASCGTQARR